MTEYKYSEIYNADYDMRIEMIRINILTALTKKYGFSPDIKDVSLLISYSSPEHLVVTFQAVSEYGIKIYVYDDGEIVSEL